MSAFKYDYDSLPELPFSVYFLDPAGDVSPKKLFTVTRKRMSAQQQYAELYILELEQFIGFRLDDILPVALSFVNDNAIGYR